MLNDSNIPLSRVSQDKTKNSHGDKLIELCRNSNIFIMNGRIATDKMVGKTTCQDKTVIDYAIGSPDILCASRDFNIGDFNPLCIVLKCKVPYQLFLTEKILM